MEKDLMCEQYIQLQYKLKFHSEHQLSCIYGYTSHDEKELALKEKDKTQKANIEKKNAEGKKIETKKKICL